MNIYGPVFYLFHLAKDKKLRLRLCKIINCRNRRVEPGGGPGSRTPSSLKNVVGEKLMLKNEAEIYFQQLEKCWN